MEELQLIGPEKLKEWIDVGKNVNIIDVRPGNQRAESHIPNSMHLDVYDKIKNNDPNAMFGFFMDKSVPIVTFCNRGKVANIAAKQLKEHGYEAYSLEGGLELWKAKNP